MLQPICQTPDAQFREGDASGSMYLFEPFRFPGAEAGVVFLASDWMPKNARHVRDRLARGSNYSWVAEFFARLEMALASLFHIPSLLFPTSRHNNVVFALDLCSSRVACAMCEPLVQSKA